MEVRVKQDPPF